MVAPVAGRSPGASSVLVGTLVEDSTHAMFLAKTPKEEEGEHRTPHQLDISWMAEHTRQVLRLLPDDLIILGSSSSSLTASWWPRTAHTVGKHNFNTRCYISLNNRI